MWAITIYAITRQSARGIWNRVSVVEKKLNYQGGGVAIPISHPQPQVCDFGQIHVSTLIRKRLMRKFECAKSVADPTSQVVGEEYFSVVKTFFGQKFQKYRRNLWLTFHATTAINAAANSDSKFPD